MVHKLANHDVVEVYQPRVRARGRSPSWREPTQRLRPGFMRAALSRDARIFIQVADCAQAKDVPPALPSMLGRIVDHMATLERRTADCRACCCLDRDRDAHKPARHTSFVPTPDEAALERDPLPRPERQHTASASHQRPSPRCATRRICGLEQCSQRAPARSNRITSDSWRQSIG